MKENNEKKINNEHEISKLIKAFPKDIAALDKRSGEPESKNQETLSVLQVKAQIIEIREAGINRK